MRASVILVSFVLVCLCAPNAFAIRTTKKKPRKHIAAASSRQPKAAPHVASVRRHRASKSQPQPLRSYDPTAGDNADGEDLSVRRAAVEALGPYDGSVVVVDPQTGRILSIVNQKTAFEGGFTPCSTIKLVTAFAALNEGLVGRRTLLHLTRRSSLDMVEALAHSNNPYFVVLGDKLGYERVMHYAHLFGLGEKAGWNIAGETPGLLPESPPQFHVGMMTAYGEGIQLTPLELAALISAIANGGTLYHLQYPRSQEEIANFVPRIKRHLDIAPWIDDVKVGMRAAVDFGTAQRADDPAQPILGKTGTCHDAKEFMHLGWFGSFNDAGRNKLVVVVLLTGGPVVNGPIAAGVAGSVYRQLSEQKYFADAPQTLVSEAPQPDSPQVRGGSNK